MGIKIWGRILYYQYCIVHVFLPVQRGPQWYTLEHVDSGEILIELKKSEATQVTIMCGDVHGTFLHH